MLNTVVKIKMNSYFKKWILLFFLLLPCSTLKAQTELVKEFQSQVNSSEYIYFKVLSEHYEEEINTQRDTIEYIKNKEYSCYVSKTATCIVDTHRLLIDHENKMIVLIPNEEKQKKDKTPLFDLDSTKQTAWEYQKKEKYFYTTSEQGNIKNEFRIYFNSANELIKTIFISQNNNVISKDVLTYLTFCLDENCVNKHNSFQKLNEVVTPKGKDNWDLLDTYKKYDLSIY